MRGQQVQCSPIMAHFALNAPALYEGGQGSANGALHPSVAPLAPALPQGDFIAPLLFGKSLIDVPNTSPTAKAISWGEVSKALDACADYALSIEGGTGQDVTDNLDTAKEATAHLVLGAAGLGWLQEAHIRMASAVLKERRDDAQGYAEILCQPVPDFPALAVETLDGGAVQGEPEGEEDSNAEAAPAYDFPRPQPIGEGNYSPMFQALLAALPEDLTNVNLGPLYAVVTPAEAARLSTLEKNWQPVRENLGETYNGPRGELGEPLHRNLQKWSALKMEEDQRSIALATPNAERTLAEAYANLSRLAFDESLRGDTKTIFGEVQIFDLEDAMKKLPSIRQAVTEIERQARIVLKIVRAEATENLETFDRIEGLLKKKPKNG